jgi:Pentapeptide repeats (8 copies)
MADKPEKEPDFSGILELLASFREALRRLFKPPLQDVQEKQAQRVKELSELNPSELRRMKLAREVDQLESPPAERNRSNSGLIAVLIAAAVTLSPVFFSFVDHINTQKQEEYKQFTSLIQVASNSKGDQSRRVGAIWLLERYWKPDYEEVLANVLSSLIGNGTKDDEYVMQTASEVIGHAYEEGTARSTQVRLRVLLYGKVHGVIGTVMRAEQVMYEAYDADKKSMGDALYEMRVKYFGEAVRKNWENLEYANLQNARLKGIRLYTANAAHADMEGADLTGGQMFRTDLNGAHLQGAWLQRCDLRGADLYGADMSNAHLENAHMQPFDDYGHLISTNLAKATLKGAHLNGADLSGVKWEGAHLDGADLSDASVDSPKALSTTDGKYIGAPKFLNGGK